MAQKDKKGESRELICQNRKAKHDYAIGERLEVGIVLVGTEVKACRAGKANLNDAWVQIHRGEAFMMGGHISEYTFGNRFNHTPVRNRKLLMHRKEIDKLEVSMTQKGMVAIPLSMYFKDGKVKVEVGVGKGKSHEDRRDTIKERETKREMDRAFRRR